MPRWQNNFFLYSLDISTLQMVASTNPSFELTRPCAKKIEQKQEKHEQMASKLKNWRDIEVQNFKTTLCWARNLSIFSDTQILTSWIKQVIYHLCDNQNGITEMINHLSSINRIMLSWYCKPHCRFQDMTLEVRTLVLESELRTQLVIHSSITDKLHGMN